MQPYFVPHTPQTFDVTAIEKQGEDPFKKIMKQVGPTPHHHNLGTVPPRHVVRCAS